MHSVLHCKNRNQFIQFQKNLNFLYDYTNIFPFLPMHDFSLGVNFTPSTIPYIEHTAITMRWIPYSFWICNKHFFEEYCMLKSGYNYDLKNQYCLVKKSTPLISKIISIKLQNHYRWFCKSSVLIWQGISFLVFLAHIKINSVTLLHIHLIIINK